MIELRGIGFSYPGGDTSGGDISRGDISGRDAISSNALFEGLDFTLREGEHVGLVGANGSGKSTLMRLIMGLRTPKAGEVLIFGNHCRTENDFAQARRRMGFLFQDSDDQLFSPTVEEDIAFGPLNLGRTHKQAREDVVETCKMLGISDLRKKVTHKLSGGQKRLVALATAAAMRPDVYILDEPTAGIDEEGMRTLLRFLDEHVRTCLIASHDREFLAKVTDREFRLGATGPD